MDEKAEITPTEIGLYIKSRREALDITRLELARRSGISHTEIYRIESGERKKPSLKNLNLIAKALHIPSTNLIAKAGYDIKEDTTLVSIGSLKTEQQRDAARKIIDGLARGEEFTDSDFKMICDQVEMALDFIKNKKKKENEKNEI